MSWKEEVIMIRIVRFFLVLLVLSCASCSFFGDNLTVTETPKYSVVSSDGNIEIRNYSKNVQAFTYVPGERRTALSTGFKTLAAFIFGENSEQAKIAMTSPVTQQQVGDMWQIGFFMPQKFTEKNIPTPNNEKIVIKSEPEARYIAIKFSGLASKSNLSKNKEKLDNFINTKKVSTVGNYIYAFYDPPWTLPFLRRNEILLKTNSK